MQDWLSHVLTAVVSAVAALGAAYFKGRSATDATIEEQISGRIREIFEQHGADFDRYAREIKNANDTIAERDQKHAEEMQELRRVHAEEMQELRRVHAAEQARWQRDRKEMTQRINTLTIKVARLERIN